MGMRLELERISSEMIGFHALAYMDLVEFELGNWDFEPVLLHEPLSLTVALFNVSGDCTPIPSSVNKMKSKTWRPRNEKHQAIKALLLYLN